MSVSADLLWKARSQAGMTARELAARAGVSASTVTRIERDQMDPTVKMLMRLLEAAGADLVIDLRQPPPTPSLEDVEAQAQVIQDIVSRHGGSNVRVVGSVTRGEARRGSDVDLLVDIEPGTGLLKVVQMEQELADALPWPVDVITSGAAHGRMAGVVDEAVAL